MNGETKFECWDVYYWHIREMNWKRWSSGLKTLDDAQSSLVELDGIGRIIHVVQEIL